MRLIKGLINGAILNVAIVAAGYAIGLALW